MSERDVTEEQVHEEHIRQVHVPAHWAYFFGVIVGGFLLMVALIARLGSGGG